VAITQNSGSKLDMDPEQPKCNHVLTPHAHISATFDENPQFFK